MEVARTPKRVVSPANTVRRNNVWSQRTFTTSMGAVMYKIV
jgi:hypothetical protein